MRRTRRALHAGATALAIGLAPVPVLAETLTGALAKAYEFAPTLNAVRAAQRALDEGVAIARSGYRPNVSAEAEYSISGSPAISGPTGGPDYGGSIAVQQRLFDGFQRQNAVRGAKAAVFAGQEDLKANEQDTLLAAVQAYVSVIRDQRIVGFRQQNIAFLDEQLNAAQARFEVGEGTRTDVAQARAERAASVAELQTARANLAASEALYVQIVGQRPVDLANPSPASRLVPASLDAAVDVAMNAHPDIRSAQFTVEETAFGVKQAEGAFLPSLDLNGTASRRRGGAGGRRETNSSYNIGARLTVPLYQGGRASATVRQSKERLSQARIGVDVARTQVRSDVVQAYSRYQAALAARASTDAQIAAARLALEGLIEERNVGQRTTLDVLIGRQQLINAQIAEAQNEAVIVSSSYEVVEAVGRMTAERLGLHVQSFEPDEHYVAVVDKWYGLRTPDQR